MRRSSSCGKYRDKMRVGVRTPTSSVKVGLRVFQPCERSRRRRKAGFLGSAWKKSRGNSNRPTFSGFQKGRFAKACCSDVAVIRHTFGGRGRFSSNVTCVFKPCVSEYCNVGKKSCAATLQECLLGMLTQVVVERRLGAIGVALE